MSKQHLLQCKNKIKRWKSMHLRKEASYQINYYTKGGFILTKLSGVMYPFIPTHHPVEYHYRMRYCLHTALTTNTSFNPLFLGKVDTLYTNNYKHRKSQLKSIVVLLAHRNAGNYLCQPSKIKILAIFILIILIWPSKA